MAHVWRKGSSAAKQSTRNVRPHVTDDAGQATASPAREPSEREAVERQPRYGATTLIAVRDPEERRLECYRESRAAGERCQLGL
jgi:hypothetical protein